MDFHSEETTFPALVRGTRSPAMQMTRTCGNAYRRRAEKRARGALACTRRGTMTWNNGDKISRLIATDVYTMQSSLHSRAAKDAEAANR